MYAYVNIYNIDISNYYMFKIGWIEYRKMVIIVGEKKGNYYDFKSYYMV
jgi:hypothetical protein